MFAWGLAPPLETEADKEKRLFLVRPNSSHIFGLNDVKPFATLNAVDKVVLAT